MKVKVESQFVVLGQDIEDGDLVQIFGEGKEVEKEFRGEKTKKVEIQVQGGKMTAPKKMSLNKTSLRNIIALYGDDTKAWEGKELRANIVKQLVSGEMKNVLIFTAPNVDLEGKPVLE